MILANIVEINVISITRREGKTDRGREKNAIVHAMVSNATALLDNLSSVKK